MARGSKLTMLNSFLSPIFQFFVVINIITLPIPAVGVLWKTKLQNVPKMFLEAPANINAHNYSMILNYPNLCDSKEQVFLLILVRSIPENVLRRQIIRSTWGNVKSVKNETIKVAFLFGNNNQNSNKILKEEQIKYKDILQETFQESYASLHLKTVMAWKWALKFCSQSLFFIVCNDEIFVDIFQTVSYLNGIIETKQHKDFYACSMEREAIIPSRNLKHKHGVSWTDYPGTYYPAFCNGNGYLASKLIIRKFYEVALNTPPFMPDDAWCGVLAAKLSLVISNIQEKIPISTKSKIIEYYLSPDQYAKNQIIFFPLDRKFSSCEICVAYYLWQKIILYNSYESQLQNRVDFQQEKVYIVPRVLKNNLIYVSFLINVVILASLYFLKKNSLPLFLTVLNLLFLIILIQNKF